MTKKMQKEISEYTLVYSDLKKTHFLDFTYRLELRSNRALAVPQADVPISAMRLLGVEGDGAIGVYKRWFRIAGGWGLGVSD